MTRTKQRKTRKAPWVLAREELHGPGPWPKLAEAVHVKKVLRKAIRKTSARQRKRNAEYTIVRAEFLSEHKWCAVYSYRRATEVHHIRGRTGPLLTDKRGFLAVSFEGHRWIDNNRQQAQKNGWLATKGEWGRPYENETGQ
jgi:hypothetical protein